MYNPYWRLLDSKHSGIPFDVILLVYILARIGRIHVFEIPRKKCGVWYQDSRFEKEGEERIALVLNSRRNKNIRWG
jgi:hypothetical protein